jgi:protein-tyrosine-phosphatase/DNA-binding transcriptional ArsR family regulator
MITEPNALTRRVQTLAALADPVRLSVVDALAVGDRSPGDLARHLAVGGNLLAHHLNVLEGAGLVERVRSEADRRRTYVRLRPAAMTGVLAGALVQAWPRVVFVCTKNSARSQLASAVWQRHSPVPTASAGTHPATRIHPGAVAAARRHGLRLGRARPRQLVDVVEQSDFVVTVCDSAHEELETAGRQHVHWAVSDPVPVGTDEAFDRAYLDVAHRVRSLADQIHPPPEVLS